MNREMIQKYKKIRGEIWNKGQSRNLSHKYGEEEECARCPMRVKNGETLPDGYECADIALDYAVDEIIERNR